MRRRIREFTSWALLLALPRVFPSPWLRCLSRPPTSPCNLRIIMTQVATIIWTDPPVGAGQAALATLEVYAALDTQGNAGPLQLLGSAAPGAQTFTTSPGQLAAGAMYYFTVKATDVNGLQSLQGNWGGPVGPVGAPSPPTNVQASLG